MRAIVNLLQKIKRLPPIIAYRKAAYREAFFAPGSQWPRFYGLFSSRREAEAIASTESKLVGYDHPMVAQVNLEAMAKIWTADYPVLFWLSRILRDQQGLFDLGGHVGTKYRAWQAYLDLPDDFTWLCCDLPKIVEVGRVMAADLPQLHFTTDRQTAADQDILLASGVLQYADFHLRDLLEGLASKPRHILLNKVPTHSQPDVYTLENIHHAVVPYRIFNETVLLKGLLDSGFAVIDRWTVPESSVRVPYTNLGEPVHFGYYLRYDEMSAD